jgi:hypothetical protein
MQWGDYPKAPKPDNCTKCVFPAALGPFVTARPTPQSLENVFIFLIFRNNGTFLCKMATFSSSYVKINQSHNPNYYQINLN